MIIACALLAGCEGLMRDVETPRNPSDDKFLIPTSAASVLQNLENAFIYRDYSIYMRCFVDSSLSDKRYTFHSSPVKSINFSLNWTILDEENYFRELLSSCPNDSSLSLILSDHDVPDSDDGDSLQYQIDYQIYAGHTRGGIDHLYRGSGVFRLVRDNRNYWVIYDWQDIPESGTLATWSDLKAYF